ncbi:MAG: alpha amylase C-terminal domain-containing protein [Desulfobacterales bacterium]|nr:alpha amylase C-terminal domain-containing protein [Desulfobacterales bacterium]
MVKKNKNSVSVRDQDRRCHRLIEKDSFLKPFESKIKNRFSKINTTEARLTGDKISLSDFASGHEYFGLHLRGNKWVFREWAPNATAIYLIGDMSGWQEEKRFELVSVSEEGVWEITLPAETLHHKDLYRLSIHWPGGEGNRIPAYTRRVVQDPESHIFNAQVWCPPRPYIWNCPDFKAPDEPLLIYEAHVGMAQEEARVGSYREFAEQIIPKIVDAGYNALQLMAIQEHPYYGSFGYQVSSFFAASSRFGTPEDLMFLIDTAHMEGLSVIVDLIHSHAVSNEVEGLSRFDGSLYQYFHNGPRGTHPAWDSRCFDYGKYQVLHFLLSNCRFWLDAYRFDGIRFDGITSMLYLDHGLQRAFTGYEDYFNESVDEDALAYLALANRVIHEIHPGAVSIAEDISGMPGLAVPGSDGGYGFDYRFAMGVPDYWIRLTKDMADESWPMDHLWFELTNRRNDEKCISYAESHDQALVGDQTLIFRLIGVEMYDKMRIHYDDIGVNRGIALHKMIRLITIASAGNGYLNFMGNEFGHPEWIDFPREGNNWSYHYARRQWHLSEDSDLYYSTLKCFDQDMIKLVKTAMLLKYQDISLLYLNDSDKIIAFKRSNLIFIFNFHPQSSQTDYQLNVSPGKYVMILDTDRPQYGGHSRLVPGQCHFTHSETSQNRTMHYLSLYLPSRSAIVLKTVS